MPLPYVAGCKALAATWPLCRRWALGLSVPLPHLVAALFAGVAYDLTAGQVDHDDEVIEGTSDSAPMLNGLSHGHSHN